MTAAVGRAAWRLLALPPAPPELLAWLVDGLDIDVITPAARTQPEVLAAAPEAEIILGDWEHALRVDGDVLAVAPVLAFVQQPAAGVDTIDIEPLAARGIPVANTGGANTVAVAEWCLLSAMAMQRSLLAGDAAVRAGQWPQLTLPARELAGSRVGILGMGRIGAATAARFAALGAVVSYWSRTPKPQLPYPALDLAEVFATSDVLVCLLPGVPDVRGLVSAERLATVPSDAIFISAGRGTAVDEPALLAALHHGPLGAAALDVYATEPLPVDSPLRSEPKLLLSPHVAGSTAQSRTGLVQACRANLHRALAGEPLLDVVNGTDPVVRRRRP